MYGLVSIEIYDSLEGKQLITKSLDIHHKSVNVFIMIQYNIKYTFYHVLCQ